MPGVMQRNGHADGYHGYDDRRGYSNHEPRYGYDDDYDPYRREDPYSRRVDPYRAAPDPRDAPPYRTTNEPEPHHRGDGWMDAPVHPPQRVDHSIPRPAPPAVHNEHVPSPPLQRRENDYPKQHPPPVSPKPNVLPKSQDNREDAYIRPRMPLPVGQMSHDARTNAREYQNFPPRYQADGDYGTAFPQYPRSDHGSKNPAQPQHELGHDNSENHRQDKYERGYNKSQYQPQQQQERRHESQEFGGRLRRQENEHQGFPQRPEKPEAAYQDNYRQEREQPKVPYGGKQVYPTPGLVDMYPNQRTQEPATRQSGPYNPSLPEDYGYSPPEASGYNEAPYNAANSRHHPAPHLQWNVGLYHRDRDHSCYPPYASHAMNAPHNRRRKACTSHQGLRPDPAYRDPADLYSNVHKGPVTNGNGYPPHQRSAPYHTGDPNVDDSPKDFAEGDHDSVGMRDREFEGSSYELDHLATFTVSQAQGLVFPDQGIRRLRQMEASTGIWTMRCTLLVEKHDVLIVDKQTGDQMECFPLSLIKDPAAVTNQDRRDIYNNILLFTVLEDPKKRSDQSEMHLFQCLSRPASEVVDEIKDAQQGKIKFSQGLPRQRAPEPRLESPELAKSVVPDRIREYEMAAQQAAIATSKYQPGPAPGRAFRQSLHHDDNESTLSDRTERDVQLLNHCIDDIERFVGRLQQAADTFKELQRRKDSRSNKKNKKKSHGEGMLTMRARPPPAKEFIDVFQKFKLSFNLLAKLRPVIHDPNAPELVHFLFTPLSLIVQASKDPSHSLPDFASKVVAPLLSAEAKEMLSNCLSSKEYDLWYSLGDSWTLSRDEWRGYIPPFFPRFYDGWQPTPSVIDDGPGGPTAQLAEAVAQQARIKDEYRSTQDDYPRDPRYEDARFTEEPYRGEEMSRREDPYQRGPPPPRHDEPPSRAPDFYQRPEDPLYARHLPPPEMDRSPREDPYASRLPMRQAAPPAGPPAALSFEDQQRSFAEELRSKGAKAFTVQHERVGKNHKELTVRKGEVLELLDDSRNWWKLRNYKGESGHCPYTILQQYTYDADSDRLDGGYYDYSDKLDRFEQRNKGGTSAYPQQGGNHSDSAPIPAPPAPPPIPPTLLFNSRSQQNKENGALSPRLRRTPIKEENRRSQQDILNDELKMRVTQGKGRNNVKKRAPNMYITEKSTPLEVEEWLVSKGFSERVVMNMSGRSGRDMFMMKRSQIETICGHEEGTRLDSQLTVQKNITGYKTLSTAELSAILQKRKERADVEMDASKLGSPPSYAPDSPNDSGLNSEASSDAEFHTVNLRDMMLRNRLYHESTAL